MVRKQSNFHPRNIYISIPHLTIMSEAVLNRLATRNADGNYIFNPGDFLVINTIAVEIRNNTDQTITCNVRNHAGIRNAIGKQYDGLDVSPTRFLQIGDAVNLDDTNRDLMVFSVHRKGKNEKHRIMGFYDFKEGEFFTFELNSPYYDNNLKHSAVLYTQKSADNMSSFFRNVKVCPVGTIRSSKLEIKTLCNNILIQDARSFDRRFFGKNCQDFTNNFYRILNLCEHSQRNEVPIGNIFAIDRTNNRVAIVKQGEFKYTSFLLFWKVVFGVEVNEDQVTTWWNGAKEVRTAAFVV